MDRHATIELEPERLPLHKGVGPHPERRLDITADVARFEQAARHHLARGQSEVRLALDGDRAADTPGEAESRHIGIVRRLDEAWMVAAHRDHEVAGMLASEPEEEREAASEPAVLREQPRVVRQSRLDRDQPLDRRKARLDCQLDVHQRRCRCRWQRCLRHAQDPDLEAAIQQHVEQRLRVDQRERRELDAGRKPVAPPLHRERRTQRAQERHRVIRHGRRVAHRRHERELWHPIDRRHHQAAIVAEATRKSRDEEVGRSADRNAEYEEHEERRFAVRDAVTAERHETLAANLDEDEAVVSAFVAGLQHATRHLHAAAVVADGKAAQPELPFGDFRQSRERHREREVIHADRQASELHAAVQQDGKPRGIATDPPHADLLDGHRPERALDREPDLVALLTTDLEPQPAYVSRTNAELRVHRRLVTGGARACQKRSRNGIGLRRAQRNSDMHDVTEHAEFHAQRTVHQTTDIQVQQRLQPAELKAIHVEQRFVATPAEMQAHASERERRIESVACWCAAAVVADREEGEAAADTSRTAGGLDPVGATAEAHDDLRILADAQFRQQHAYAVKPRRRRRRCIR